MGVAVTVLQSSMVMFSLEGELFPNTLTAATLTPKTPGPTPLYV